MGSGSSAPFTHQSFKSPSAPTSTGPGPRARARSPEKGGREQPSDCLPPRANKSGKAGERSYIRAPAQSKNPRKARASQPSSSRNANSDGEDNDTRAQHGATHAEALPPATQALVSSMTV